MHLLVSFHIFDSVVGRVLVKLVRCLGKHSGFPREEVFWRQRLYPQPTCLLVSVNTADADQNTRGVWERLHMITHWGKGRTADQTGGSSKKIGRKQPRPQGLLLDESRRRPWGRGWVGRTELKNDCACVTFDPVRWSVGGCRRENLDSSSKFLM